MDPSALSRTLKRFEFALKAILIVCGFVFAARFTRKCTDGFTITGIHSSYADWEVNNPTLPEVFDQKFTYLGSGGQCFVFASEDGSYVLKFFKYRKKINRDFASYKLAMEQLPEETGLLYVHLKKTDELQTLAKIVDKLGIEHEVDLDKVNFILQKRAELTYPHLLHLVESNDIGAAKEAIDSLCSLIKGRCQKGIHDDDAKIHRNCGFIGNRAVIIDVGRFKADPRRQDPNVQSADLIKCTEKLKCYLDEISPELATYLDEVRKCSK